MFSKGNQERERSRFGNTLVFGHNAGFAFPCSGAKFLLLHVKSFIQRHAAAGNGAEEKDNAAGTLHQLKGFCSHEVHKPGC